MNSRHREIRTMISVMAPKRARSYIEAFGLQNDEEQCLILHDVDGLTYPQISDRLNLTPEGIKYRRKMAFTKIADAMAHEESRG